MPWTGRRARPDRLPSPPSPPPAEAQALRWWWRSLYHDHTDFDLLDAATGNLLVRMYANVGTSDQWQQYAFNVTPYAGQTVRLRVFNGDANHYVYLVDVLLASYPTTTFTLRETNPPGY